MLTKDVVDVARLGLPEPIPPNANENGIRRVPIKDAWGGTTWISFHLTQVVPGVYRWDLM